MIFSQETLDQFNNEMRAMFARNISFHSLFDSQHDQIQVLFNLEEERMYRVYDV